MKIPARPPGLQSLWREIDLVKNLDKIMRVGPLPAGHYLHWDELLHREPPSGFNHKEWWAGVKFARMHLFKQIELTDKAGQPFQYALPDAVLKLLHEIDQDASGGIQLAEEVTNPATRDRYIVNSLIEESITSSQLEGAATTADVARDMIRSGRKPIDRSERMILNNFHAMRFVQGEFVCRLHSIVSEGTLDEALKAGCLRTDRDNIVISDPVGTILHTPPPASELPSRLKKMCDFANARPSDSWLHPVLRAIILHFWLGFDHPFVDGNGRTARALFYWSMLSHGYWLTEYLSISRILRMAPSKYSRSFLYTELDDNDLTYFVLYQLEVLQRSIEDLKTYLRKKMQEIREVRELLKRSGDLNYRQLALLGNALKHPGRQYTVQSHRTSHYISYQTARTDLLDLARRGLLQQFKIGKLFVFASPTDLSDRIGGTMK